MKLYRATVVSSLLLTFPAVSAGQGIQELINFTSGLDSPTDLAIDGSGNVFVSSGGSDAVFKIEPGGAVSTVIDASGDGAGNPLSAPSQITVDAAGNVYIAGAGSDNAFRITPAGVITELIDSNGDGAGNILDGTRGIAVDGAGNVYVTASESDNAFKIEPGGAITEILDATGDGLGNAVNTAIGVRVDSAGNAYVVSKFSASVHRITPGGAVTLAMSLPGAEQDIAIDSLDNVYVTGSLGGFQIDPGGTVTQIIDNSGDGLGNVLTFPTGVAVDGDGNAYVAGFVSSNVFKVTPGGTITQIIDATGDGLNPLTNAYGVEVDGSGKVYVVGTNSDNAFEIGPPTTGRCDVILAELTGDGLLDAAAVDVGNDSVTLFAGDGLGAFDAGTFTALTAGDQAVALASGNLVTGGGSDLAVAAKGADAVRILSNAPEGTLSVSSTVDLSGLGANPVAVHTGDVDGSGLDDLAIALEGELLIAGLSGVAVSLDGGAPVMLTAPAGGFGEVNGVHLCDLDGDGDQDVMASMGGSIFVPGIKDVLLYEGDGAGGFAAPIVLSTAEEPKGFCCSDIDGDGDADLLVTTQDLLTPGGVEVLINDGLTAGTWSAGDFSSGGTYAGGDSPIDIACADLDDENIAGFFYRNDAVTVNLGSGDLTRHDGFINAGSGFEGNSNISAGSVPAAVAIADLNGDKTPDIVVANKAQADLTVILANPQAQAMAFGAGCAGTGGLIPAIGATNLPAASAADFSLELTDARAFAPAILALSLNLTPTALGACNLYVDGSISAGPILTDGSGAASLPILMPGAASPLFGCDVFYQWAVIDPSGALAGLLAFSDGLRTKFAN
ncbi:MAG: SBBP repeat-containing protein [Planctomycetota bacterium]